MKAKILKKLLELSDMYLERSRVALKNKELKNCDEYLNKHSGIVESINLIVSIKEEDLWEKLNLGLGHLLVK